MKNIIAAALLTCAGVSLFAQSTPAVPPTPYQEGSVYLGLGTGLANSGTGYFGIKFDTKVANKVMLGVGAGISSWGGRISFTGSYITKSNWCPMISIARSGGTGNDSIQVDLELADKTTKKVGLQMDAVNTISLGVEKNWYTPRGNRFYLDLGYAFSMSPANPFRTADPSVKLSNNSVNAINFIAPGGLVIGVGYTMRLK